MFFFPLNMFALFFCYITFKLIENIISLQLIRSYFPIFTNLTLNLNLILKLITQYCNHELFSNCVMLVFKTDSVFESSIGVTRT